MINEIGNELNNHVSPLSVMQVREKYIEEKLLNFTCQGRYIPCRMWGGIIRWIVYGIFPGDFLTAVIRNDLREAVWQADDENIHLISTYVSFFYNEAPSLCSGNNRRVDEWHKARQQEWQAVQALPEDLRGARL